MALFVGSILALVMFTTLACSEPPARSQRAHIQPTTASTAKPPKRAAEESPPVEKKACSTARPRQPPNPEVAPLEAEALVDAMPKKAGRFTRGNIVTQVQGDYAAPRDTTIVTYYGGRGANARFTVEDMAGRCELLGPRLTDELYANELAAAAEFSSPDEAAEQQEPGDRRVVYARGEETRTITAVLGHRCRVALTLEYGDSRKKVFEIWSALDLDALEAVCLKT